MILITLVTSIQTNNNIYYFWGITNNTCGRFGPFNNHKDTCFFIEWESLEGLRYYYDVSCENHNISDPIIINTPTATFFMDIL